MESLTESEIVQIAKQQRDAGVQRLSRHFSWPEFCDERQGFHQEFVYDFAMFAVARGFPWPDVIRSAAVAKSIFPQLDGLDLSKLLSLLRDLLPQLTSVHQHDVTRFLTDTCITRRKLFQAAVAGAANLSFAQLHLEVQPPPAPCPLAQGTDKHEWVYQCQQAELTSKLLQKEEKLEALREGSRVKLGEVDFPEDEQLDKERISALVGAAVRAAQGQMLASLTDEASLLSDILQLKLQQETLATRRLQHSSSTGHEGSHSATPAKEAKQRKHTAKKKVKD